MFRIPSILPEHPMNHRAFVIATILVLAASAQAQTTPPVTPAPPSPTTPTPAPTPAPTSKPTAPASAPKDEVRKPPSGLVIFFQALAPEPGLVGTGWFIKTPKGEAIGATSLHLLDLQAKPLESVSWIDFDSPGSLVSSKSFGQPGIQPSDDPDASYRHDYLLLALDPTKAKPATLELDPRELPRPKTKTAAGERVWFPIMDSAAKPDGVRWVPGEVLAASAKVITITLDEKVDLPGTSGTPIVSQETGKVIGMVSAGHLGGAKSTALLAPARAMWEAVNKAEITGERPALKSIDWNKHKAPKVKPRERSRPNKP